MEPVQQIGQIFHQRYYVNSERIHHTSEQPIFSFYNAAALAVVLIGWDTNPAHIGGYLGVY